MALWVCDECTSRYAESLTGCPECGGGHRHEEGNEMPKVTVGNGPTYDGYLPGEATAEERRALAEAGEFVEQPEDAEESAEAAQVEESDKAGDAKSEPEETETRADKGSARTAKASTVKTERDAGTTASKAG